MVPRCVSERRRPAVTVGIIGGNGFVGSGIARGLAAAGMRCASIQRENYGALRGTSYDVLVNANGNSKKYLAAESPAAEFAASVASVQQSLVDFSCGLYVHCSSVDVYPDHEHPEANSEAAAIDPASLSLYGFHKYLAEQIVRRYARRWLILRFGGFVGDGLKKNSVYDILHNVPLRVHAESMYQYLSTDAAGGIVAQLIGAGVEGTVLNVCGDGCISPAEIIREVPGYALTYAVDAPPRERYDISVAALGRYCRVPRTRDSVLAYVRRALAENAPA